jgi:hypothetical protein
MVLMAALVPILDAVYRVLSMSVEVFDSEDDQQLTVLGEIEISGGDSLDLRSAHSGF